MPNASKDSLLLALAQQLSARRVSSEVMRDALARICEGFAFRAGAIYLCDTYSRLDLEESYAPGDMTLPERFTVEELPLTNRQWLAKQTVAFTRVQEGNGANEDTLLRAFGASALAVYAVADDDGRIGGLAVLLEPQFVGEMAQEELRALETALGLLGKSLQVRSHDSMLSIVKSSLESILDNTGIDIYVNDFYNHDILYVNQSMAAPYGGPEAFMGNKCWQVLFPGQTGPCEFCPQPKLIDEEGIPTKVYTWDYQRPFDGSWFRVFSAAFRWIDGRLAHVVSSADITDNKKNQAIIEYMANYDSLTRLPNRRMMIEECERRINQAAEGEQGYVLFFDIDDFKSINDTYGHDAGDEFLVQLGAFFTGIPLLKDAIYRNGGDEFVAIIGGDITKAHIRGLAGFIHARFQKPWKLSYGEVMSNTSIGVACYPEDGTKAETLLTIADRAMYQVKKQGKGNLCFGYELQNRAK